MAEDESAAVRPSSLRAFSLPLTAAARTSALFAAVLAVALIIPPTTAAEINLKSTPTGQTLFPKQQFQLQCWQEGIKIIEEQALRTNATAPELGEHLASFAQGEEGNKLILVTLGQTLCMIKTRT